MRTDDNKKYFTLPGRQIANNSKVASQSIYFAIWGMNGCRPVEDDEPKHPIFMLVRNPIDRFISALATLNSVGLPVDWNDPHLLPQSRLVTDRQPMHLYRYPDQIPQFTAETGLPTLPWANKSLNKPTIDDGLENEVRSRYAEDFSLWNSHSGFAWDHYLNV